MKQEEWDALKEAGLLDLLYSQRISELIRRRYSSDDEFAIQRQRDEKPDDFKAYYDYAEECKKQAYKEVYEDGKQQPSAL